MVESANSPPAGWYPDPAHHGYVRFWNGAVWTAEVAEGPAQAERADGRAAARQEKARRKAEAKARDEAQHIAEAKRKEAAQREAFQLKHLAATGDQTPNAPAPSSDTDNKRREREARKAEARNRKSELRAQKQAAAAASTQAELERCGREIESGTFGFKTIRIYERGFVKVSGPLERSAHVSPRRLISIEASADVGKKSATGRAVGAVMTGGINLLGSNKRGDVYLTIVTDGRTYALKEEPPTASNMKTSKRLEAVGNSVLQREDDAPGSAATPTGSQSVGVRERLAELKALLDDGLISQQECDEKRRALLDLL